MTFDLQYEHMSDEDEKKEGKAILPTLASVTQGEKKSWDQKVTKSLSWGFGH